MRVVIPQITWHSRDPVLSVDFDPTANGQDGYYRLASGGGDCQLLIWRVTAVDTFKPEFNCVAELKRHEKPVNVVRFSPDGTCIATGGDDAYVILWKCGEKTESGDGDNWQFEKSLRKHIEDVSDLSWSPDGNFLVSASIDNSAVFWDIKKGVALHVWSEKEHSGFVHGVAYDPLHEFAATMCIDRHLRFFDLKTKKLAHKALKFPNEWISSDFQEEEENAEKENVPTKPGAVEDEGVAKKKTPAVVNRLFQDEFLPTFCRRLSFSPKGELLLVPGGMLPPGSTSSESKLVVDVTDAVEENQEKEFGMDEEADKKGKEKKLKKKSSSNNNAVIIFCRHSWTNPCAVIPTLDSYSIGTRFCPVYFKKLRQPYTYDESFVVPKKNERSFASIGKIPPPKDEKFPLMKMPYRLVYAVATNDSVLIGDTASSEPLAVVRSIHLARITDITWSSNGQALVVSSTDGYCSIITFEKGELGEEFSVEPEKFPALTRDSFPILPPEPKKEKVAKRKKAKVNGDAKATKEKESKSDVKAEKTPASRKKPVAKSNNLFSMFTAAGDKGKPKCATIVSEPPGATTSANGEQVDSNQSGENAVDKENTEETPKFRPQKTTLDRWFTKTPKSAAASGPNKEPVRQQKIEKPPLTKSNKEEPEIIILDDEKMETEPSTSSQSVSKQIYPMTPPPHSAKPIAVRRVPTAASPLLTSSTPTGGQKRKQRELTPESLHQLQTAPLKCRRIMEEPEILMESSNSPKKPTTPKKITPESDTIDGGKSTTAQETPVTDAKPTESPKVTASNCPASPVSSSTSGPKPPRRIALVTLAPSTQSDAGKLD